MLKSIINGVITPLLTRVGTVIGTTLGTIGATSTQIGEVETALYVIAGLLIDMITRRWIK